MNRTLRNFFILLVIVGLTVAGWMVMTTGLGSLVGSRGSEGSRFAPPPSGDTPASPPKKMNSLPYRERVELDAEPTGRVRVRTTWKSDGEPAAGVLVYARRLSRLGFDPIFSKTDRDGVAILGGVEVGRQSLRCLRGGSATAEVLASKETEVLLQIPEGTKVKGRLRDESGEPVVGAEIMFQVSGSDFAKVVGTSDMDGAFELRDVEAGAEIGARASGYQPSDFTRVFEVRRGSTQAITLVMKAAATRLTGTVHAAGESLVPLAGVQLRVSRYFDGTAAPCPQQVTYTNDQGEFVFESIWRGRLSLSAQCKGYGCMYEDFEMDSSAHRAITLDAGASIRGVVRARNGSPVPGAVIMYKGPGRFHFGPRTRTGPDGRFALSDLSEDTLRVMAIKGGVGRATSSIILRSGHFSEWNPVLDPGLTISGRVIDEAGAGLPNWLVNARYDPERSGDGSLAQARTKSDGSFVLTNIRDPKAGVELSAVNRSNFNWRIRHEQAIMVGAKDVILHAPAAPKHSVTGIIHDANGALGHLRISLGESRRGPKFGTTRTDESGRFEFAHLHAGNYVLLVSRGRGSVAQLPISIAPSEESKDCGILQLPTAKLTIRLKTSDPKILNEAIVTIEGGRFIRGTHFINDGVARRISPEDLGKPLALAPGTYQIESESRSSRAAPEIVTLGDGQERELLLDYRATQDHDFVIHLPTRVQKEQLWWRVSSESSKDVDRGQATVRSSNEAVVTAQLYPGEEYSMSVHSTSGTGFARVKFSLSKSAVKESTHVTLTKH